MAAFSGTRPGAAPGLKKEPVFWKGEREGKNEWGGGGWSGYRVGVDLGGTKTEAALLDCRLNVLARIRVRTPGHDYNQIVETIASLASRVLASAATPAVGLQSVETIGVCTPGTACGADGVISNSNLLPLQSMPLRRDLQERLGRDILIENDANCFALAEAVLGAGAGFGSVFGVIMGTGVGGGIVMDGRIYGGRTGLAGEWGHHVLHRGGSRCYCGMRGCVEAYISGPALERRWAELAGERLRMPEIVRKMEDMTGGGGSSSSSNGGGGSSSSGGGAHATPKGYTRREAESMRVWRGELLENFGHALADVVSILDPDAIVLGGGLSNMDLLYGEGAEAVRSRVFSSPASDVPILRNRLGDSAGVIGACLLERRGGEGGR